MARHSLLTVLSPPDSERAAMIRQLGSNPQNGSAAELLIDCEEDRRSERYSSACCVTATDSAALRAAGPAV
jgi:hypothetical protein